jgi:hypothetical protein
MAMKVYINGDTVEIDQTAQPLLNISRNKAIYRIENDDVTIFNNEDRSVFRTDKIAAIQNQAGTAIGNLQDVVKYLSKSVVVRGTSVTRVATAAAEANTASNVGGAGSEGLFKQKVGVDLEFKSLVAGTGISLSPSADEITINLSGAPIETNIVNVLSASDLPATLAANTAYIINGSITTSQAITTVGDNSMIIGRKGRDTDKITYTGIGTFISLVDVNFTLRNVTFSATDSSSRIIDADNYSTGSFNEGRDKTLSIFTCQFRNCYDVMTINGYDLVDINNTLFFYVQAINHGLEFHSTSKIELSSCELLRWFDESTLPTPSGWALAAMFCIVPNGAQVGVGALNISGCIMHPQQTQDAIKIDPASTTAFATISSNTFVTAGLTTGVIFSPTAFGLPDYSQTATLAFDVFANQGVLNSVSGVVNTLVNNVTDTAIAAASTPVVINTGGGSTLQAAVRYAVAAGGRSTYIGSKQVYVSIHASISYEKQGGGSDTYNFFFYKNGVLLPGSQTQVIGGTGTSASGALSMIYGTLMNQNDYIEIYVENDGGTNDILIKDYQLVIRE